MRALLALLVLGGTAVADPVVLDAHVPRFAVGGRFGFALFDDRGFEPFSLVGEARVWEGLWAHASAGYGHASDFYDNDDRVTEGRVGALYLYSPEYVSVGGGLHAGVSHLRETEDATTKVLYWIEADLDGRVDLMDRYLSLELILGRRHSFTQFDGEAATVVMVSVLVTP